MQMTTIQTNGQETKEMVKNNGSTAQSWTIVYDWNERLHTYCPVFEHAAYWPDSFHKYWESIVQKGLSINSDPQYNLGNELYYINELSNYNELAEIDEWPLDAYLEFLDILDEKGCINKELAFGGQNNENCRKMVEKWQEDWKKLYQYTFRQPDNAFLHAIVGRSKEEVQILANLYPEELTNPKEIAFQYIGGNDVLSYAETFTKEFFEIIKSEHLLYAIFWHCETQWVLDFVHNALEYDKDYFRDYRDEVGNTALHLFLMPFELLLAGLRKKKISHDIKSLLLAGGVSPETPNDGGLSYKDLHRYTAMYRQFSYHKARPRKGDWYRTGWIKWITSQLDQRAPYDQRNIAVDMARALKLKHPALKAYKGRLGNSSI